MVYAPQGRSLARLRPRWTSSTRPRPLRASVPPWLELFVIAAIAQPVHADPPQFTQHPLSASACETQTVQFTVTVNLGDGPDPALQWQFDNGGGSVDLNHGDRGGRVQITHDLSNTTAAVSTLTLLDLLAPIDAGDYRCAATAGVTTTLSNPATLLVYPAVAASASADAPAFCRGDSTRVRAVAAGGVGNYTYLWSIAPSSPNASPTQISNPTAPSPLFTPLASGPYSLLLTVSSDPCPSAGVSLSVLVYPTPSVAPTASSAATCVGEPVTLDAHPLGSPNRAFLWSVVDGPDHALAQLSDATIADPIFTPAADGIYRWRVTLDDLTCDHVASGDVSVPVRTPVTATPTAEVAIGCANRPVQLDAHAAGGDGSYVYAWSVAFGPDLSPAQFSNTTAGAPTFTPTSVVASQYVLQVVVVDGVCEPSPTASLNLEVVAQLQVNPTAAATSMFFGDSVDLDAHPSGGLADATTFTWSIPIGPNTNPNQFDDRTLPSPEFTPTAPGTYRLRVVAADGVCAPAQAELTLLVTDALVALPTATPSAPCVNQPAQLAANVAGGDGVFTYTWSILSGPDTNLAQLSNPMIAAPTFTATAAGNYVLRVQVGDKTLPTEIAQLTLAVGSVPTITSPPQPTSVCHGDALVLTVAAGGNSLAYQWRRNGVNVSGQTQPTLNLLPAQLGHSGDYSVSITNPCGTTLSQTALVTVEPPLVIPPLRAVVYRDTLLRDVPVTCEFDPNVEDVGPLGGTILRNHGLAAHPVSGDLYAAVRVPGSPHTWLASVDRLTGAASNLRNLQREIYDLAFHPDGTLYAVRGDDVGLSPGEIFTVDYLGEATLTPTNVPPFPIECGHTIAFDDQGRLYHHGRKPGQYARLTRVELVDPPVVTVLHNFVPQVEWAAMSVRGDLFLAATGINSGRLWLIDRQSYAVEDLGPVTLPSGQLTWATGLAFDEYSPRLELAVSVEPSAVLAGNALTYTIHLANAGVASATDVVLHAATPSLTTFVSHRFVTGQGDSTAPSPGTSGVIQWILSEPLSGGAGIETELVVQVAPSAPVGSVIHQDSVQVESAPTGLVGPTADATALVVSTADIHATLSRQTVPPMLPFVRPGDRVQYELVLTNTGPDPTALRVTIPPDSQAAVQSDSVMSDGTVESIDPLTILFEPLASDDTAQLTFQSLVHAVAPLHATVCYQADVLADGPSATTSDDPATSVPLDATCLNLCDNGDFTCDGQIDLADFEVFQLCTRGPGVAPLFTECRTFDFNADQDVDLEDWGEFQNRVGQP